MERDPVSFRGRGYADNRRLGGVTFTTAPFGNMFPHEATIGLTIRCR